MTKLIALGLAVFSITASAENPIPTEKVSREAYDLAKLLYTPEMHAKQLDAAVSATLAQLAGKPIKVDTDRLRGVFAQLLKYQEMVDFQAGLLAKYYSSQEMSELGLFYSTPLGKKALKLLPQLTQDAMGFAMQLMTTPEAQALLKSAFVAVPEAKPVKGAPTK